MAEVCELLDVKKTRTTAYHPQSDGMVERFNQTLEAQLSKFADHNQRDWDQHIPFLLMAYRSAVHDTTGNTPAKMMLGRDLKLPVDLSIGRPEEETFRSAHDYLITMQERLERIHDFAREHQNLMTDRMKQRYDLPLKCPQLKTGDAVWLHNPQRRVYKSCSNNTNYLVYNRLALVMYGFTTARRSLFSRSPTYSLA